MENKKIERNSNFELMRIISMFLIVVWHFIIHSHLLDRTSGTLNLFLNFIFIVIAIHVNSFVLISGYFQYNKKFKQKKLISLISTTWFYKLIYALIFCITGITFISKVDLLFFIQPLNFTYNFGEFYWFINMYIFLYLLSPFINKLLGVLKQKEHKRLIIILFIMLSIIPSLTLNSTLENSGYTIASFVMLYIIGAYFGKYNLKENFHFKNYSKNKYQIIILSLFVVSILLSFSMKIFADYFHSFDHPIFKYISSVFGSTTINFSAPALVIESVLYLLLFETFNFKNKFINKISSLTFGIYLVHENKFLFLKLYDLLPIKTEGPIYSSSIILHIIIYSILIFIVSAIIEYIRQLLSKAISKTKVAKKITNKVEKYIKEF